MSTIKQLLKEYSQVRVSYEAVGRNASAETNRVLNLLAAELTKNNWKCSPSDVPTDTIAMCAFFEMFAQKIGGVNAVLLSYFYSSRVAKDFSLPTTARVEGNKIRAFTVFKNIDQLSRIFNFACNSPIGNYKGKLNDHQFVDLLLLSDVYQAWDADNSSAMLQNLKKQTPMVAANYPTFTRQQIITEGELAHDAVLNIINTIIY